MRDLDELAVRVRAGDVRAVARAITLVENEEAEAAGLMARLYPCTGGAYLVGVTGPPGAGKSTLVDQLTLQLRKRGAGVGVVAVDPTSPFSGGAILGDRVRMQLHAADPGVFIRSMATRGHLGGLSRATSEAALILDAAGKQVVLIETVGVGQDEVDIVRTADVSIVVLVPGTGDDVQALKAGIMEIADIFVVNKADREGVDRMVSSVETLLALQTYETGDWRPPIVKTEATTGVGVVELLEAVERFRERGGEERARRQRQRCEARLRELVADRVVALVDRLALAPADRDALVDRIVAREIDPYSAADELVKRVARI